MIETREETETWDRITEIIKTLKGRCIFQVTNSTWCNVSWFAKIFYFSNNWFVNLATLIQSWHTKVIIKVKIVRETLMSISFHQLIPHHWLMRYPHDSYLLPHCIILISILYHITPWNTYSYSVIHSYWCKMNILLNRIFSCFI